MTYQGPIALGVLAGVAADDAERRAALAEAETLLAAGSLSHNHLLFGMAAVDQALAAGEWDEAERYASSLADYTAAEPLPLIDFANPPRPGARRRGPRR
ncbi:MAG: hypothetical protein U1E53_21250 [Dongiaceae bacterium]